MQQDPTPITTPTQPTHDHYDNLNVDEYNRQRRTRTLSPRLDDRPLQPPPPMLPSAELLPRRSEVTSLAAPPEGALPGWTPVHPSWKCEYCLNSKLPCCLSQSALGSACRPIGTKEYCKSCSLKFSFTALRFFWSEYLSSATATNHILNNTDLQAMAVVLFQIGLFFAYCGLPTQADLDELTIVPNSEYQGEDNSRDLALLGSSAHPEAEACGNELWPFLNNLTEHNFGPSPQEEGTAQYPAVHYPGSKVTESDGTTSKVPKGMIRFTGLLACVDCVDSQLPCLYSTEGRQAKDLIEDPYSTLYGRSGAVCKTCTGKRKQCSFNNFSDSSTFRPRSLCRLIWAFGIWVTLDAVRPQQQISRAWFKWIQHAVTGQFLLLGHPPPIASGDDVDYWREQVSVWVNNAPGSDNWATKHVEPIVPNHALPAFHYDRLRAYGRPEEELP